jgi:hypothetical protein
VTCVSCDECPFLGYIRDRIRSVQSHGKFVVEEENKKSVCENLTCDLKTLCALQHSDIGSV